MVNYVAVNLQIQNEKELLLFAPTVPDAHTLGYFDFGSLKLGAEKLTLRF